jgi:hypothetical protein
MCTPKDSRSLNYNSNELFQTEQINEYNSLDECIDVA